MENIYKYFRSIEKSTNLDTISKRFDEPTYISFRLLFGNEDNLYNSASNKTLYDTIPHPLFNPDFLENPAPSNTAAAIREKEFYSSIQYLIDANEPTRAQMLRDFISKFNTLQNNFPYYFQQIDGVSDLLKIDPVKGQRISNDKRLIITCLEGLDLRMSYLLNLYKKIVWDDVYQRWVLPDMMRYFTLKIYLTEFRTFHQPFNISNDSTNTAGFEEVLRILDGIMPVWQITCEMCEFDITDINHEYLSNLSINSDPNMASVKFAIKVGNIKEIQMYPLFKHMFLDDRKLNGRYRSKDETSTSIENNPRSYLPSSLIAQSRDTLSSEDNQHISGYPYIERRNENNVDEADIVQERIPGSTLDVNFNPAKRETWAGNAINFGKSYANNFVNQYKDKLKTTSIPGLGVSFNEIKTAIDSKNILVVLGMIRKGVDETINEFGNKPSSRLEGNIKTDSVMTAFLKQLTKSEATDGDALIFKETANQVLSDKGLWEKIKDYSLATDLVGTGLQEVNTKKEIIMTPKISSNETNTKKGMEVIKIIEGIPSSSLNNKLDTKLIQPKPGRAGEGKIEN